MGNGRAGVLFPFLSDILQSRLGARPCAHRNAGAERGGGATMIYPGLPSRRVPLSLSFFWRIWRAKLGRRYQNQLMHATWGAPTDCVLSYLSLFSWEGGYSADFNTAQHSTAQRGTCGVSFFGEVFFCLANAACVGWRPWFLEVDRSRYTLCLM